MKDVDGNPFGERESKPDKPMGENIPLIPGEEGVPTWDPGHEQETRNRSKPFSKRQKVNELYDKLFEVWLWGIKVKRD